MKKLLVSIVALVFAAPLVASAQTTRPSDKPARDSSATTKDSSATTKDKDSRPVWKGEAAVHESSEIIGTAVKNAAGKNVGKVDRLLIDPQSGRVSHVVIGLGGVMGVGDTKVVVPWSDLKMTAHDGGKAAIVLDDAKLASAPRYEREKTARADRSPAASPSERRSPPRASDMDKDGKKDSADKAPADPTRK